MKWSPDVTLDDVPGSLPPDEVPKDIDLTNVPDIALELLKTVNEDNLVQYACWKDWLCLTGTVRTYNGASTVARTWTKAVGEKKTKDFQIGHVKANMMAPGTSWITVSFTFTTTQERGLVGICSGSLGLVPGRDGRWKIWFITSVLENFDGHGNPDEPVLTRADGDGIQDDFQVAVLGAGQSGLSLSGRMQALGIKYVLLERLPGVGQSWVTKYDTVKQHTLREYNNLPFDRTWSSDDEDLLPAAKVTEGFEKFATKYNLNVWMSVAVNVRSWDSKRHRWTLDIEWNDGSGQKCTITCQHLALAIGGGVSEPKRPKYLGEENFQGEFLLMRDFKNSKKWKGKHGVVIGSGTAGHDIAQDMLDNGLSSVTMIQRQKTAVYPIDWVVEGQEGLYNMKIPTNVADRMSYAMPQKIGGELMRRSFKAYVAANKAKFDALEQAGFKLDTDALLIEMILRRWGGYYIDVGTSKHIADGDIKVKSGVEITRFTEDGIIFADETELKTDVVVLAAGYNHDYRRQVATIVGNDIAEQMGEFWGLTKDGDVRGTMEELAPGLWLLAGACGQARFWSRFVALKMQAGLLGMPLVELSENIENGVTNHVRRPEDNADRTY